MSGGSKLTKITEGAVTLDGSGDYLYIPPSSDWDFGTGAYTLEAFINTDGTGINQEIFDLGLDGTHSTGNDIGFRFRIGTNDILYAANHSGGSVVGQCYDTGSAPIGVGRWYHIAYVRDGNNFATFIDGKRIATATSSSSVNWNSAWGVKLGYAHAGSGGAQHFKGKISNARIFKGTALYDPTKERVIVPTAPLTNVTNTKLLCCQSNTSATELLLSLLEVSQHTETQQQPTSTHSILISAQFVDKRLVMQLLILLTKTALPLCQMGT